MIDIPGVPPEYGLWQARDDLVPVATPDSGWGCGFDRPNNSTDRGGSNVHFVLNKEF